MYYLGIDGGGTKTEMLLKDETGVEVKRIFAGPCNPNSVGMNVAKNTLKTAITEILYDIDYSSVNMFAGISGGGLNETKAKFKDFFSLMGFNKFKNGSDNENIIEQGLKGRDGLTVIAGTGICIYKMQGGEKSKAGGGWGFFLDIGGGGFNFGKDALKAHFSALDGIGEKTYISDLIEKKGCSTDKLLYDVWRKGNEYIASFCPIVFKAAELGDKVAKKIIEKNIRAVVNLLKVAEKSFNEPLVPVVLAGSFGVSENFYKNLIKALPEKHRYSIEKLHGRPVDGAVNLAMKL